MGSEKITDSGIIGIDAGGTFTDLAFLRDPDKAILARAKTPTKHDDLAGTIETGLSMILAKVDARAVSGINLASTLATNAIVEDKLQSAAIFLLGYPADAVQKAQKEQTFGTDTIISIRGGHDVWGVQKEPLDEGALEEALLSLPAKIKAVAVSGYFSVRNPAHEDRAMQIIGELRPKLYVTCGHELAMDLDAIKRATTCGLNAGLIPIVMDLLDSVGEICSQKGLADVPLSIVRGDGSLVSASWAKLHPVEMILSGPAASACGAYFLAGAPKDGHASWAVDIGGTTTDIICLDRDGRPALTDQGATVAGHKTLIRAIDINTFGLGGDSRVRFGRDQELLLGPRRVRPLCVLATEYPSIVSEMRDWKETGALGEPLFLLPGTGEAEDDIEKRIQKALRGGPRLADALLQEEGLTWVRRRLDKMERSGSLGFASFTPTDALHILGLLDLWDGEASFAGAEMFFADASPEKISGYAEKVRRQAVTSISTALLHKCLAREGISLKEDGEGQALIRHALSDGPAGCVDLRFILNGALIGVGAPAWAFIPQVGECLHGSGIIHGSADVAGAVGAAVGSFSMAYTIWINKTMSGTFRAHLPMGYSDHADLEDAVERTCARMLPWIEERARRAGASDPQVTWTRDDRKLWEYGAREPFVLYTQMIFHVSDDQSAGPISGPPSAP